MRVGLAVRNTFIFAVDVNEDDDRSPPSTRRRACSDGLALLVRPTTPVDEDWDESWDGKRADDRAAGLAAAIEGKSEERSLAMADISASAWRLSCDQLGSRVVQRALELATPSESRCLAESLRGRVVQAARSPHAHFVLQKLLHHASAEDASFIAEELVGHARGAALHMHAGHVICRLIEHAPADPRIAAVVDEVLAGDPGALCCHKFGHRVAVSVISNGLRGQRDKLLPELSANLQRFARHRFASQVLGTALLYGTVQECRHLASELMAQAGAVASLACHAFGVHVVRGLLEVPQESEKVRHYLCKSHRRLRKDRYGFELMRQLGIHEDPDAESALQLPLAALVGGA